jgi:hypothetical protein
MITFIYGLVCPISNEIRYIGKSNDPQRRLKDHLIDFRGVELGKAMWIRDLKMKNLKPELLILDEINIEDWEYWEKFYISYFRGIGANILNTKPGGNGLSIANHMTFKKGQHPWNKGLKKLKEKRYGIIH